MRKDRRNQYPVAKGRWCKKCGVEIALDYAFRDSKLFNEENNILYCRECKPELYAKSHYNQPKRRFWIKADPNWAKLRHK